ncbi:MAG TPA: hypothetical protein VGM83_19685 [Devosiaceae bacterium]|jgi:hypothetical protein
MTDADADLVRNFIADEHAAFADRRPGKFWPANQHGRSTFPFRCAAPASFQ